jgi:hypothetical protein
MVLNGYFTDIAWLNSYLDQPNDPDANLIEHEHVHYGTCLLFGTYLYERFGTSFLTTLVSNSGHGVDGLLDSLQIIGQEMEIDDLFLDWATATLGDALDATDPKYSHPLIDFKMPDTVRSMKTYPASSSARFQLPGTCAAYVELKAPEHRADMSLSLVAPASRVLVRKVLMRESGALEFGDFSFDETVVPFASEPDLKNAYLVFWATEGVQVSLRLDVVNPDPPEEPDAGVDGGDDAGADGAPIADEDVDASTATDDDESDAGSGSDGADQNGGDASEDGGSSADEPASDGTSTGSDATDEKDSSDGSSGCANVGQPQTAGPLSLLAGVFILLVWRRRGWSLS